MLCYPILRSFLLALVGLVWLGLLCLQHTYLSAHSLRVLTYPYIFLYPHVYLLNSSILYLPALPSQPTNIA